MKKRHSSILAVAILACAGALVLVSASWILHPSIKGSSTLVVSVETATGSPVSNLEVDLGSSTGPPPEGGIGTTNAQGNVTFHVVPGVYVVYFNKNNFSAAMNPSDANTIFSVAVLTGSTNLRVVLP